MPKAKVIAAPVVTKNDELYAMIPTGLENLSLPDPVLLNQYKNLQRRILWVDEEVDESVLEHTKQILLWNADDKGIPTEQRKPIWVFVHTYGGALYHALNLIDAMTASETPIYTVNAGIAFSAGCEILLAGSKRFAMKHSTAMIHSGSGGFDGTYEQTEQMIGHYRALMKRMDEYNLARTNIDEKMLKKKKAADWYFTAEEQLANGIVHEIVESMDAIL